jgi:hypothetical protein
MSFGGLVTYYWILISDLSLLVLTTKLIFVFQENYFFAYLKLCRIRKGLLH